MVEIIKAKHIQILDHVENWETAVKIAAEPLLQGDYIEPRYVDAIFENTKKMGPYYVLAHNIAMPHAGVDDGVLKQQVSLLILKNPVKFSEDGFEVRLVFLLAATDNHSHLETLRNLAEVFSDDALIDALIASNDVQTAASLLNNH